MAPTTLNITDARKSLPDLVKRAEYAEEEIAIGPRGKTAAVLIGANKLEGLRRELARVLAEVRRMRTEMGRQDAMTDEAAATWGAIREAVRDMPTGTPGQHSRRFIPAMKLDSDLPEAVRVRIGLAGDEESEFHRLPSRE